MASRRQDLVVHVLTCNVSETVWEDWYARLGVDACNVVLRRHDVDCRMFESFPMWKGGWAAYARLMLPQLLAMEKWCVYVDGDTLFVDDPFLLEEFFASDYALWGHFDSASKWCVQKGLLKDGCSYVCSGFILMNLNWFREHDGLRLCLDFLEKYPDTPYPDQDALNVVCAGKIALLPNEWGIESRKMFIVQRAGCVHYNDDQHPWNWRWTLFLGVADSATVWICCAQVLSGRSVASLCGFNGCLWALGRIYNRCVGLLSLLVVKCGIMPSRFPDPCERFAYGEKRRFLHKSIWERK